jgi:hypothetical protein
MERSRKHWSPLGKSHAVPGLEEQENGPVVLEIES